MRRLPVLVLAGVLAGCGGGAVASSSPASGGGPGASAGSSSSPGASMSGAPASPAPKRLSPADDGRVYTMDIGQTADLIVPDPTAPDPTVSGDAVEVAEVVNIAASGQRQWELRAVHPGQTVISGEGTRPYTITLVVPGA